MFKIKKETDRRTPSIISNFIFGFIDFFYINNKKKLYAPCWCPDAA